MSTNKLPQIYSLFTAGEDDLEFLTAVDKAGWQLGIEGGKFVYYHPPTDTRYDSLEGGEDVLEKARYIFAGLDLDETSVDESAPSADETPIATLRPPRRGDVAKLVRSLSDQELDQFHAIEDLGWTLEYENEAFALSHSDLSLRFGGLLDRDAFVDQVRFIREKEDAFVGQVEFIRRNAEAPTNLQEGEPQSADDASVENEQVPEEPAPLLEAAKVITREENVSDCKLNLYVIRTDGGTQPRAGLDEEVVDNYREGYIAGAKLPPLDVFYDGSVYWLADGFHRLDGAKRADFDMGGKLSTVDVHLHQGTRRDAVLFSVGANATHGLPRTNADKHRAVMVLLNDPDWSTWSDGLIARTARVSQPFVSALRRKSTQNGFESTERKGADGRAINTEKIGAKAKPKEEPAREEIDVSKPDEVIAAQAASGPTHADNLSSGLVPQEEADASDGTDEGTWMSVDLESPTVTPESEVAPGTEAETAQAAPAGLELTHVFPEGEVPTRQYSDAWNNATITLTIQLMPTAHKEVNRPVLLGVRNDDDSPLFAMVNAGALNPMPGCVVDLLKKLSDDLPRRVEARAAAKPAAKPATTPAVKKSTAKKTAVKKSATKKAAAKKSSSKKPAQASA